ncbi:hypothetical protein NEMIN01_2493, partial [Nematocida minor]|uniref:uncharacterized protein n=1 Tax=Nematocida minor TaxID=1912983 RepID=UPI00222028A2
ENIIKVKNSFGNLFLISLDQKKYLIEKMKELLEAHGVKVVVDGVETEPNRLKISEPPLNNQPPLEEQAPPHPASAERKIVSALKIVVSVSLVVLFIVSTIVFGYRIENRMKSTNN